MKVEYNIARLKYLLELYKISVKELLVMISEGLKKPISEEELFKNEIEIRYLKRIDKVFEKGFCIII